MSGEKVWNRISGDLLKTGAERRKTPQKIVFLKFVGEIRGLDLEKEGVVKINS